MNIPVYSQIIDEFKIIFIRIIRQMETLKKKAVRKPMKTTQPIKTWYQLNYKHYELYSMKHHQETTNQITYHWDSVPESVLHDSGFLTSFRDLRMKRKGYFDSEGKYYNLVREYGLDGISFDDMAYHGIQCKLWDTNRTLHEAELDTFFVKMNQMRIKNEMSKGYLYHTCKLEDSFKTNADFVSELIFNNKLRYDDTIHNDFNGNNFRC